MKIETYRVYREGSGELIEAGINIENINSMSEVNEAIRYLRDFKKGAKDNNTSWKIKK